jgi:hypothetical protein
MIPFLFFFCQTTPLHQKQMADLFQKDTDTIGLHIGNIFKEGELKALETTEKSSVVQLRSGVEASLISLPSTSTGFSMPDDPLK